MKARTVALITLALLSAASGLRAQPGREVCADAARVLVRQETSWDNTKSGRYGEDVLRWRARNGASGYCRVDVRGRVTEVRVESWGDDITFPGGGGWPPGGGGSYGDLTEERGYDRKGDDIGNFGVRSLAECKDACRRDPRCRAYTYSTRDSRCWIKSRVNSRVPDYDMVTGYKSEGGYGGGYGDGGYGGGSGGAGGLTEEQGFDRRGNDYTSFRARALSECQFTCRRDDRCRAYTFDTRNGTCYLKDRVNSGQYDPGMVTGYKTSY
jgi:hypothetical protein